MNSNNKLNLGESFNQEQQNFQDSLFPEITYENENIIVTHNSTGEERYFINNSNINKLANLTNKRERSEKKEKNPRSKFSYNNLIRETKHLVIENVMNFINKKINEVYEGNIGDGLFKLLSFIYLINNTILKDISLNYNFL